MVIKRLNMVLSFLESYLAALNILTHASGVRCLWYCCLNIEKRAYRLNFEANGTSVFTLLAEISPSMRNAGPGESCFKCLRGSLKAHKGAARSNGRYNFLLSPQRHTAKTSRHGPLYKLKPASGDFTSSQYKRGA